MKRFDELSDAEINALNDEQVAWYMDLACAEDGVPLMPPDPGPAPQMEAPERDVVVYEIAGLAFRNHADAESLAFMLRTASVMKLDYARGGSYKDRVAVPSNRDWAINSIEAFSPNRWDEIKNAVTQHSALMEQWEKDHKEWIDAHEKRSHATEWMRARIEEARNRQTQRARFATEMERYTELANGDREMAVRFLLKAHPDAADFIPQDNP